MAFISGELDWVDHYNVYKNYSNLLLVLTIWTSILTVNLKGSSSTGLEQEDPAL